MKQNVNNKRPRSRPNMRTQQHKSGSNDSGEQRGEVKVRGNFHQVYEKYVGLAREAGGDRVLAENYYQHAEHYFRIMREQQAYRNPPQQQQKPAREEAPALDVVEITSDENTEKQSAPVPAAPVARRIRRHPAGRVRDTKAAIIAEVGEISEVVIN